LASGISHDFNNILLAVLGNAELSRMELPQDSPVQRNLAEVVSAVKRGKELVQQVLALGRRTEPRQVPVKVHSIVKEVIGLMRAGVPGNIEVRHQKTAHSDTILADPAQVHQVLMNLCTNAIQAMEDEGGILDVRVGEVELGFRALDDAPELPPGKYVTVTVSDTGPGMSAEIRQQIFEPFYTTKQSGIGTGLGLAVVQGIVSNYEGMVAVESELGQGAAFTAYFPAAEERQVAQSERRENAAPVGVRILFVDDDDAPLRVGTRMLERLGCDVVATASAEDALEQFRADPASFGALVTDLTMPGMSGLELAAAAKQIRPELPVVLCTGLDAAPDVEHAVSSGICRCLTKPYGLKDLEGMLATILGEDSGEAEI
jgi:CheY-like chemotaxis protein